MEEEMNEEIKDQLCKSYRIQCTHCSDDDEHEEELTRDEAAQVFINKGWVIKLGHCLCPKCAELPKNRVWT